MGDECNDFLTELPFLRDDGRDLAAESMYEYGSRAGVWRFFRVFEAAGIPVTFFATAVAMLRNPSVARRIGERRDEVAGHGFRWTNAFEMSREEEREGDRSGGRIDRESVGVRPVGVVPR